MSFVTVCSDFGAQENKICHCFYFSPSICHAEMGRDAMILGVVFFFFVIYFLTGRKLLYNISLVSVVKQCNSLISIHISPPSWASFPSPPSRSQSTRLGSLCYITTSCQLSTFHMVVYIYDNATFTTIPLFASPTVSTSLFSVSVSPFLLVFLFMTYLTLYNRLQVHISH